MFALYARQSVERENSVSIETQLDFCRAMIKPNERHEKVNLYIDEGYSGGNTNRVGFLKMMHDIENNRVTKVITYKLDRISRSLNDFVGILQTFKDHGVEFVSSQESFDTSSIYGELILKILIVFAEFERTSIINRVRDAYAKRSDMGLYMGGRHQYGFELQKKVISGINTKVFVPIPEAMIHVQHIFQVYAQEQVSLRRLLDNLLANGFKPCEGKDWTTAKLSTLLKNPVYVKADSDIYNYFESRGVRIVNDLMAFDGTKAAQLYGKTTHDVTLDDWSDMKLVLMQHEGVIPSSIWLKCQRKLEQNKQVGNSLSNKTSWLAGKLFCAKCGQTMTTIKNKKTNGDYRRYFNCTGKSHKKTCSGVKATIYAEDIELLVENCISEKLKSMGTIQKSLTSSNTSQQNALKLKLTEVEMQQKKLGEMLLTADLNIDMISIVNQKATDLAKQRQILLDKKNDLTESTADIKSAINLAKRWQKAKYEEKKAVTNALIKSIIIYEDGTPEIVWYF